MRVFGIRVEPTEEGDDKPLVNAGTGIGYVVVAECDKDRE
jgi:hypothetical protein